MSEEPSQDPDEREQARPRWRTPWAAVMTLALLALFEMKVARSDWFWGWVPYSQMGVIDALEKQVLVDAEPLVLFMGSSRVRDAISPRTMEQSLKLPRGTVLNLGLTMGTPFDAEILYERNRDRLKQAKLVFFGVEPFQLDVNNRPTERILRYGSLKDRLKLMDPRDRAFHVAGYFWRTLDTGEAMRRFVKTGFKAEPELPPITPDGRVRWRTPEDNKRVRRRRTTADAKRFFHWWRYSPNRQEKMRELIEVLEADGMKVVIFQVPARDRFWTYAHDKYPEKVKSYSTHVREAAAGHDVYMFWDASEHRLSRRNFFDYGHLKPRPARSFTRRMASLIWKNYPELVEQLREAGEAIAAQREAEPEDDEDTEGDDPPPRRRRTRPRVAPSSRNPSRGD